MRRKNPHPQRAVNVKTVVVGDDDEEEGGGGGEEPLVLCLQIPDYDDDDDEMDEQIRKEEPAFRQDRRERESTSAMFARSVLVKLVI